jgi:hypothetical protein
MEMCSVTNFVVMDIYRYYLREVLQLHRGIIEFRRGCQPISNLMNDENGDLLADSHNIFKQAEKLLLPVVDVHSISDVR